MVLYPCRQSCRRPVFIVHEAGETNAMWKRRNCHRALYRTLETELAARSIGLLYMKVAVLSEQAERYSSPTATVHEKSYSPIYKPTHFTIPNRFLKLIMLTQYFCEKAIR